MEDLKERLVKNVSTGELERRWKAAREVMKERKVDFLLMRQDEEYYGGHVRWFTGIAPRHSYPFTVIFPSDEEVCSSDGTTDDAVWPGKPWMDLAINHTCTSSTPRHDLRDWYLAVARNTRAHGKPAWCNESGRERRHQNDDGVHRRKQGWLWYAAGCFWTWHSWDGCEGINDRGYRAPGEEFLRPMVETFRALPFWRMNPNQTVAVVSDPTLVQAALATAERDWVLIYCCTRDTGRAVSGTRMSLRLPNGAYRLSLLKPADGALLETRDWVSKGPGQEGKLALPSFMDDLAVRIERTQPAKRTTVPGTQ